MMELSLMKKKCSQKIGVRQYKKSSIPRLRWTPQLHELFIEAVQHLGGGYKATPKRIQQMMAVKGLKISHVKSHLQMYRNLKVPANLNSERPQFSWSSPQHVCETLEHGPSKSSKQMDPGSDQFPNYKAIINAYIAENNIYCYDYQEAQGSLSSGMTNEEEEDGGPSSETCEFPHETVSECEREINFWPLDNYHQNSHCDSSTKQVLQSTKDNSHINLDLSISSCFYC
ncbi:myb family transcription factor MPH1-like [Solanum dulcamara]|uniref:myb family transcription factor MPH1-like n=1 Tax=Solanum dulcamara TaxID=45834 RepID=UPI0024869895|nr:myb family transcription factor MPH1-like [Solanum dulcamara]